MTCTKCDEEALKGRTLCRKHLAEYHRERRRTIKPMNEREAQQEGFEAGVAACVAFLRQTLGDRAATGYQAAQLIDGGVRGVASGDLASRRLFLQSLAAR